MAGKCFSLKLRQYTYEVCPFDKARQKEGGSDTDLGSWKGWGEGGDKYRTMKFEGGERCWNGPERSISV
jgi:protein kinase C substrate 80K-H